MGLCVSRAGAHVISNELLLAGREAPKDPDGVIREFASRYAGGPGTVTILGLEDLTAPFASGSSLAPAALICLRVWKARLDIILTLFVRPFFPGDQGTGIPLQKIRQLLQ